MTVIAPAALHPSLTVTPLTTLGTIALQLPSVLAFGTGEQFTVGAVVSVTENIVVQVALLPAASVAVTVILCAPKPSSVPAAVDCLELIPLVALQLSLAVTPLNTFGIAAWQLPSVLAFGTGEQFRAEERGVGKEYIVGQVALLPDASVAVTVIVCAPKLTSVPAAGE